MRTNYYEVLGCSKESTREEIKRAYHARLLEFHPDKNNATNTAEFHSIMKAWQILGDSQLRKEYDVICKQEELENEEDLIYAHVSPDELIITSDKDILCYYCKCGGNYYIEREHLKKKNALLYISCEGCTLAIMVET